MFLCQDCTHPTLKDQFNWRMLSKGPCENCKYTDLCIDIYHTEAKINPKWRANLKAALAAMEARK